MSDSYKLAILVAVVLVGGIIGYYIIAGDPATPPEQPGGDADTSLASADNGSSDTTRLDTTAPSADRTTASAAGSSTTEASSASTTRSDNTNSLMDIVNRYKQQAPGADPTNAGAEQDAPATQPGTDVLVFDVPDESDDADTGSDADADSGSDSDSARGEAPGSTTPPTLSSTSGSPARPTQPARPTTGDAPSGPLSDTLGTARSATPTTPARTYTIQPGDTLSSVAVALFGTERRWVDIAQANPTIDPTRLKVGQIIKLPSRIDIETADRVTQPAPGLVVEYIIRPNDNLSSIAQQYYGNPNQWRYIYNANRDKIGGNPDILQAGMKIEIPPVPTPAN